MLTIRRTPKPYRGTWMDRRGVQFLYHCDSSRTGLRFVAHYWIDDRRGEAQLVRGDGRTVSFRIYDEQEFTDLSEEEFRSAVERWITGTIGEIDARKISID